MTSAEAYGRLLRFGRAVVETREVATLCDVSISSASHLMRGLADAGVVQRVHRGLWALDSSVAPRVLGPYLTSPHPGYVSFWSALSEHDMIEQIPAQTFVASLGRTRRISTAFGDFSVHHLAPEVFGGFSGDPSTGFLARPEKALFDIAYIRAPRGGRVYFPEIDLPERFDEQEMWRWVARIPNAKLRTVVERELRRTVRATVG